MAKSETESSQNPAVSGAESGKTPAAGPEPAQDADATQLDPDGRRRPDFLLSFPDNEELAAVCRQFEVGDFRGVKIAALRLKEQRSDPEIRDAADELLLRIQADPTVKFMLAASILLFIFLCLWSYGGH